MANNTYTVYQDSPENITGFEQYSQQDRDLVSSFQLNNEFKVSKHFIELHILSLSDELLESDYKYSNERQLGNAQSAGQVGASVLTIDPIQDSRRYGYENGGIKLLYHFLNDLYTVDNTSQEFFIQNISPDSLELVLSTLTLSSEELITYTSTIKEKILNLSYFTGFRLNFKNNDLLIATNIDILDIDGESVVVVKLYEPLPPTYSLKDTLNIVEEISDSVAYEVDSEAIMQPEVLPTLRSANFNIEVADESVVPTGYFDYADLLSYPVSNVNSQIFSTVTEKGIDVNVDYSTFSDFIHFSSAQERLLNFKYKLDLLQSHYTNLDAITGATTGLQGVSGSVKYYEGLITGIVGNFDHYERFLYYESGSTSWPKSNTTKPYINQESTTSEAILWFTETRTNALYFDQTNNSSLLYSIPAYLREDVNNENYLTFLYMIGQHFDNLWLYAKAVTDKYDTDNRPDYGISKDLVAEALKNFGVKLYTSNKSVEDLFTTFIGQAYQSGSEVINHYITGSLTGSGIPIQPTSYDSYQKEVQKRIYHNLPLLLKSKGTERGVRALINCFGIPSDLLQIKLYGGTNQEKLPFFGNRQYVTSSLGKIRLDNTGSVVEGNTLSNLTSIQRIEDKYTDDLHTIEVGFSPTDNIDTYIISNSLDTFDLGEYLGDSRNLTQETYSGLYEQAYSILENVDTYDMQDYVRLIKFFDNTVFKMIKDFIPARSVDVTGIIVKPNLLNISKAKSVRVSADQPEYTSSIQTAFITGSRGGVYEISSGESSTNWGFVDYSTETPTAIASEYVQTPFGLGEIDQHQHEEPRYNGELSGSLVIVSDGEQNRANPFKVQTPVLVYKDVILLTEPPTNLCPLIIQIASPIVITRNNTSPYSVLDDFVFLSPTGVVFTSSSISPPIDATGSVIFPEVNYVTYAYTASKSESIDCITSASYEIEYCDLLTIPGVPTTLEQGSVEDVTSWFTTGTNTDISYTASWTGNTVGISTPASCSFNQVTGSEVSILLRDNRISSCLVSTSPITITAPPVIVPTLTRVAACSGIDSNYTFVGGQVGDIIKIRYDMGGSLTSITYGTKAQFSSYVNTGAIYYTPTVSSLSMSSPCYPHPVTSQYYTTLTGYMTIQLTSTSGSIHLTAVTNNSFSTMSSISLQIVEFNGTPVTTVPTSGCIGNSAGFVGC